MTTPRGSTPTRAAFASPVRIAKKLRSLSAKPAKGHSHD